MKDEENLKAVQGWKDNQSILSLHPQAGLDTGQDCPYDWWDREESEGLGWAPSEG